MQNPQTNMICFMKTYARIKGENIEENPDLRFWSYRI